MGDCVQAGLGDERRPCQLLTSEIRWSQNSPGNSPKPKAKITPQDHTTHKLCIAWLVAASLASIDPPFFGQNHWFGWVVGSSESHCLWKSLVLYSRLREGRASGFKSDWVIHIERQREREPVLQIYLRQGYLAVWVCGSSFVGRHGRGVVSRQGTRQMHFEQS